MYKATAIVSVYNSEKFIRNKVKNLLESVEPIQIVLIDCTGGKELALVRDLTNTKQFIKVIFNRRITVWKAMNIGIKLADTQYVVQANTDDYVLPVGYKAQIEKLEEGNDIAYFDYKLAAYAKTWKKGFDNSHDYYKCSPKGYAPGCGLGPFPMWRKSLHDKHGLLNEDLEIYSDSLFWGDLAADPDTRWGHIPDFYGVYAHRTDSLERNERHRVKDRATLKKIKKDRNAIN